ncbi:MAG: 23S rRNA (adenine(2503)-C(2))-methyltransferase RlmN [Desulfohalobiaceae bacterium]|nr:23S rRNA (adenine(2503)-C(2))-methyltransferase RlmN [Desulfohalobiaceae bacterium]
MNNILDCSFAEFQSSIQELGESPFRADQIWQWIWQKRCADFSEMTNISKGLREKLGSIYSLHRPVVQVVKKSRDGTIKFLLRLEDGELIETVLIPEKDHYTQCISSQVGCALGCSFCSTAQMGLKRNMSSGEILGQVLVGLNYLDREKSSLPLRNIVYMGMGEPLLNWPRVRQSLEVLRDPRGLNFSYRRVTLSTVGIPGKLEEFAATGLASLAVSLHAPDQELRSRIMPKASALVSVDQLIDILTSLPLRPRQRITVEYVLIGGVNDEIKQARELNRLLSHLKAKINLIALNPAPEIDYLRPDQERILAFERYLWDKGQTVHLRKGKGCDIEAACGQLRKHSRKNEAGGQEPF